MDKGFEPRIYQAILREISSLALNLFFFPSYYSPQAALIVLDL